MRFDFVPFFNPGENIPWNRVVKMMREQTNLAEQGDFTTVWLTEHHFAHNGYLNAPPNPIMMSLDLASHSKKNKGWSGSYCPSGLAPFESCRGRSAFG